MYVCMYVCMCVCVYVCMCKCVYVYACMHVYIYTHTCEKYLLAPFFRFEFVRWRLELRPTHKRKIKNNKNQKLVKLQKIEKQK